MTKTRKRKRDRNRKQRKAGAAGPELQFFHRQGLLHNVLIRNLGRDKFYLERGCVYISTGRFRVEYLSDLLTGRFVSEIVLRAGDGLVLFARCRTVKPPDKPCAPMPGIAGYRKAARDQGAEDAKT